MHEMQHTIIPTMISWFIIYSNNAVKILWIFPSNLSAECVDKIVINTNASVPSSTTNSSMIITRPVEDPAGTIYTVSVAAVDMAGRRGEQSDSLCFSFDRMNQTIHAFHFIFVICLLLT